jgi:hypothetical protein
VSDAEVHAHGEMDGGPREGRGCTRVSALLGSCGWPSPQARRICFAGLVAVAGAHRLLALHAACARRQTS